MRLNDGTILTHGKAPYDPAKAHEYYMRTRKLTGRKKGSPTFSVSSARGGTVTLTSQELTEQKAYAAKRINDIKNKLAELNTKLRVAMREATDKKVKSKREAAKPPSAAEKSKAARESAQYRDKHQQKLATKSATKRTTVTKKKSENVDPVAQLRVTISKIEDSLKAAVAKQRSLAGATKNN